MRSRIPRPARPADSSAARQTSAGETPSPIAGQLVAVLVEPVQLDPAGLRGLLQRRALERGAVGAEQVEHALQRRAGAQRAEQALAPVDGVPADVDAVARRPRRRGPAVERRDRADERLGGAPRDEHVALAGRARADRGAQVVVTADRQHRAAGARQRVAGRAGRGRRRRRIGEQVRRARPTMRAPRPTSRARAGRASRCARPATARATCSPPSRWTIHSRAVEPADAALRCRRARRAASGTSRASRAAAALARCARANGSPPSSAISRCACSSPRESCHAIAGATGSPRASSSTPVSAKLATPSAPIGPSGAPSSASRGGRERRLDEPLGRDLRAGRRPAPTARARARGTPRGRRGRPRRPCTRWSPGRGRAAAAPSRLSSSWTCRASPGSRRGCPW